MSSSVRPPSGWHYLRPNESTRYPRRIVCLDTEAAIRRKGTAETHRFMLAHASFDLLASRGAKSLERREGSFDTPDALWDWLEGRTKDKARLIVVAHNMGYDLRISQALEQLARRGWQRKFLAVDSDRVCGRYSKGSRSICLIDSSSFLPAKLEEIGRRVGLAKLPLPAAKAPREEWEDYCARDVQILRTAMLQLIAWLEANDCGMFRLTGPAQAMACFRHRFLDRYSMLAHKDAEALEAERTAAWAGRCEAYRHGPVEGTVYEHDYQLAYLSLARSLWLPSELRGVRDDLTIGQALNLARRVKVLCRVQVEQTEPVLPCRGPKGILWPVGSFTTTAWDTELALARERGARITVERAWIYKPRPVLFHWAGWLQAQLADDGLEEDALERLMLKAWARSLIGRFAMRVPVWQTVGELEESRLRYLPQVDADTGAQGALLELDRQWFERSGMEDAADAMPAICSYIMAAARVRLYRAMLLAVLEHVVYVDTDSLLVDARGHRELERQAADPILAGLRLKGQHRNVVVLGPRQLILDGHPRVAGLPGNAVETSPGTFDATLWESTKGTLARGRADEVKVQRRSIRLAGADHRRSHQPDGTTRPLELAT